MPGYTNNCSQQCSNYAGGFTCSCYLGFSFNDGLCQDIDECKLGKAKCEQICVNTESSYRCTCNPGLVLQTDGLTCKTKVECDKSNNCSYKCSVMNGTDQCYCPKGKTLAQDLNNCDDVNLCEHSHCTFECAETDSNTSYTCMCGLGQYLASNGIDCLDCVEGKWGHLCANTCNCTAVNTLRCDRLSGSCQCKSGWSGPQCEKDIDECVQGLADCSANSRCQNIDGGYVCTCIDGFVKNQTNGVCQECDSNFYGPSCAYNCSCGDKSLCNKMNGSCYCVPEWTGDNCNQDIDECVRGIHTCDERKYEKCQNTPGGYQCTCMEGYLRGCDSCLCGAIKNHDLTIVFNYNAASLNLDDKFSNDYKTTVTQVQLQLEISLKSSMNSIISVTVISIRKGSLIVDYSVVLNATLEHESNKSFHAVLRDILDKGVILFEKPVSVLDITSDGYQVTNSTCMCRDTEECIVGSDTTICRSVILNLRVHFEQWLNVNL
uniref:EGF-like domain-containing protein n=1 Tax=Biomphalaria glabrata TaxID=6526 RepID=A0A2C9JP67_BIOGL